MHIFIVIEDLAQHCTADIKNIGVYNNVYNAEECIWLAIFDKVLKDYTIEFYENRNSDFAHLRGIPYYSIEQWDINTNTLLSKNEIGNWFDKRLKKEHNRIREYIESQLDNIIIRNGFPVDN